CDRSRVGSSFFFSSRRRHTRFSRDWSSDVCSSDLGRTTHPNIFANMTISKDNKDVLKETAEIVDRTPQLRGLMVNFQTPPPAEQIGRASCRERVSISGGCGPIKTHKT